MAYLKGKFYFLHKKSPSQVAKYIKYISIINRNSKKLLINNNYI